MSMQNHYNLIYREEEREMFPLCIDEGIGLIPWSPLARGFLAGNRTRDGQNPTSRAKTDTIAQNLYYVDQDFDIVDRVKETGGEERRSADSNRTGLGNAQAGRYQPNYRRTHHPADARTGRFCESGIEHRRSGIP